MDVRCTYIAIFVIVATVLGYLVHWQSDFQNQWVFSFRTTEYHDTLQGTKYYDDLYTLIDIAYAGSASNDGPESPELTGIYDYTVSV